MPNENNNAPANTAPAAVPAPDLDAPPRGKSGEEMCKVKVVYAPERDGWNVVVHLSPYGKSLISWFAVPNKPNQPAENGPSGTYRACVRNGTPQILRSPQFFPPVETGAKFALVKTPTIESITFDNACESARQIGRALADLQTRVEEIRADVTITVALPKRDED